MYGMMAISAAVQMMSAILTLARSHTRSSRGRRTNDHISVTRWTKSRSGWKPTNDHDHGWRM